jgi:uncharacterized protein YkwD
MNKSLSTVTPAGCLGALMLFVILIGTSFLFWRLGYDAGVSDEHNNLFSVQWAATIQHNKRDFEQIINEYRKSHGLKVLKTNLYLEQTAQNAAEAIFSGNRDWSHNGYEASISAIYRGWWIIGENLARNYGDFDAVMKSWEHSPEHNETMLEPDFCEIGVGLYQFVWVAHFGCRS